MAHPTEVFAERWDWTSGAHRWRRTDLRVQPAAAAGVAVLTAAVQRWQQDVGGLDEDELWTVGRSRAVEIDQQAPFAHLVLHLDRDLVHHGAQSAALRDHYRATSSA